MKQLILDDICLMLDDLKIPYALQENKYIRVCTEFYDIGYNVEPKKVLYELSVYVDEANRCVSMYVKTSDEFLLASGSDTSESTSASIFRKVRHISFNGEGQSSVMTIDLGQVPNTVKNTAVKYGWKFRTALNLNKTVKKARLTRPEPLDIDLAAGLEKYTEPAPAPEKETDNTASGKGFFRNLFKRNKYTPRH